MQGCMMLAILREESKETNGTRVDADEMQRSMTSEKAVRWRDKGFEG